MIRRCILYSVLSILLLLTGIPADAQTPAGERQLSDEQIAANMDAYAAKILEQWNIPGMGVAVMHHDSLILCKGYGVKKAGGDDPVDENTAFQIGSISKSFTAALMAQLVDEGLVSWNDTVKNILPDFELYDKWVENNLQVKDIMTHHTGLAGQDGTYFPNLGYDRDDLYHALKFFKPTYSFRGDFQYNNITFVIASRIIEKLTGKSWEENIQERIFNPLGMTSSGVNGDFFAAAENVSGAHDFGWRDDAIYNDLLVGEDQALWWLTVVGPAGSVVSTPADLIKWAQFHKHNGKVDTTQVMSHRQMDYLHRGQTITSQDRDRTTLYAHCWYVEQTSRGRLYYHTGTTWGHVAICAWHPQLDFSIVVLVNSESPSSIREALMYRMRDLCLGLPDKDYSGEALAAWVGRKRDAAANVEPAAGHKEPEKMHKKQFYTGKYYNVEPLGDAWITSSNNKLYIKVGKQGWEHELHHLSGDKFTFSSDGHEFPVVFTADSTGNRAASMRIDQDNVSDVFEPWTRAEK